MVDRRRHRFVCVLLLLQSESSAQVEASQGTPSPEHAVSSSRKPINLLASPPATSKDNDSSAAEASKQPPPPPLPPPPRRKKKNKTGGFTVDLQGTSMLLFAPDTYDDDDDDNSDFTMEKPHHPDLARLTIGPTSAFRLAKFGVTATGPFLAAFMGTLRLLAPLILSRRVINGAGDLVYDYMRGRYIRKTYTRLENIYIRFYELPAASRALSRTAAQTIILLAICSLTRRVMATTPGIKSPFDPPGCWWAGILLASITVGSGHLCASALATWGGPLRIQVNASHSKTRRLTRVFTRPWHILQWMKDPEAWITTIASRQQPLPQPFRADPILFPATWAPLRLLQMIGVAGTLSKPSVMGKYLVQVAFSDEWYRTFVSERRVGLGLFVAVVYLIATISLVVSVADADMGSSFFLIPHLLSVIVTSWMNMIIFWERLEDKRREAVVEKSQAALRALGY